MKIIILDCRRFVGRREAHAYVAKMLGFPSYYGANLDALADCLWEFPRDVLIMLEAPEAADEYGQRMIEVFRELAEEARIEICIN